MSQNDFIQVQDLLADLRGDAIFSVGPILLGITTGRRKETEILLIIVLGLASLHMAVRKE